MKNPVRKKMNNEEKKGCWLSVMDYAEVLDKLTIAKHNCKQHDMTSECRNARTLDKELSDADLKALEACEKEQ